MFLTTGSPLAGSLPRSQGQDREGQVFCSQRGSWVNQLSWVLWVLHPRRMLLWAGRVSGRLGLTRHFGSGWGRSSWLRRRVRARELQLNGVKY